MPNSLKYLTAKLAKKHKPPAYLAVKPCTNCGGDLRVKINGQKYRCPCRVAYKTKKRASPKLR